MPSGSPAAQLVCCTFFSCLVQSWRPAEPSVSVPLPPRLPAASKPQTLHCLRLPCLLPPAPSPSPVSACRAISRWASSSAGFLRRHNPVHSISESHTLARVRGWRPWPLGQRQQPSVATGGSQLVAGRAGSRKLSGEEQGPEGRLVPLLTLLMPQTLLVVILRKAQQVTITSHCLPLF